MNGAAAKEDGSHVIWPSSCPTMATQLYSAAFFYGPHRHKEGTEALFLFLMSVSFASGAAVAANLSSSFTLASTAYNAMAIKVYANV